MPVPPRLWKRLIRWGILVLGTYLAFCVFLYFYQPRLLYFPLGKIEETPAQSGMPYEDLTLTTSDGVRINAWYVGADNAIATVLFSHGNGGNLSHRIESIRIFHELGLNVVIYDYRGYGRSEGSPSEEGTYLDAEVCWRHLTVIKGVPPGRIILFGRSLGGAVASKLAEAHDAEKPAALILESTFTSVPDMAAKFYPWLPARAICRYRYDTLDRLERIHCPVFVAHSPEDELVPYAMGKTLFAAAVGPKTFLTLEGGHNDGFLVTGDAYVEGLREFIGGLGLDPAAHPGKNEYRREAP